jgi:hypothetical protein
MEREPLPVFGSDGGHPFLPAAPMAASMRPIVMVPVPLRALYQKTTKCQGGHFTFSRGFAVNSLAIPMTILGKPIALPKLAKPIDIRRRLWYIPRQQPNTVLLSREVEGPAL